MPRPNKSKPADSTATIGFEAKLCLAADSRGEAGPQPGQASAANRYNFKP